MTSTNDNDSIEAQVWAEYLNSASLIEIHISVIDSNWDSNGFLLRWLLQNPQIDKATVLIAYWMSGPKWLKQYQSLEECTAFARNSYALIEELEEKYVSGFYEQSSFELDPSNDQDGFDWTAEYSEIEVSQEIPQKMFEKLSGLTIERPEEGYIEGLPEAVYEKLENLLENA